ncbi:MAG: zinc ribbon domain-containing protein [Schwartzia succinivorans]|nr:zinc ribbon domain-containing protein [Schwartzia succinivorans]
MGKKISFGLEMKDGEPPVRDIEALRKNFDIEKAMGYFLSGKLVEWLENRFCDEEAEKVNAIDKGAPTDVIQRQLCEALGVDVSKVKMDEALDSEIVQRNNEKKDILRQRTSDQSIIAHAAQTAFNPGDLADLWNMDEPTIYLCGDSFKIRSRMTNRTYIGVLGTPKIEIDVNSCEELTEKGIKFENVALPEHLRKKQAEKTKPCPKCGHENPATAKFCNECGGSFDKANEVSVNRSSEMEFLSKMAASYYLTPKWAVSEGEQSNITIDNVPDDIKRFALTLICQGKYSEDDLVYVKTSLRRKSGLALTYDSICFWGDYGRKIIKYKDIADVKHADFDNWIKIYIVDSEPYLVKYTSINQFLHNYLIAARDYFVE